MPDKRTHRGAHPEDARLFSRANWPRLQTAVRDLSWLLTRGYGSNAGLKLVCDHLELDRRQRLAVMRSACSDQALTLRGEREMSATQLNGVSLLIDGYNVITTVEAALGGAVIIRGRDGCYRDIAGLHGTYRKVEETLPAVGMIGEVVQRLGVTECHWLLDRPVSNSGRLKTILLETADRHSWTWNVDVVYSPDRILAEHCGAIATADSGILDRCTMWFCLAREIICTAVQQAFVVELCPTNAES